MISFLQKTELEIVTDFDEEKDEITDKQISTFEAGEPVDAEIISQSGNRVDLQFGDGSVALGVERSSFTIEDEQ